MFKTKRLIASSCVQFYKFDLPSAKVASETNNTADAENLAKLNMVSIFINLLHKACACFESCRPGYVKNRDLFVTYSSHLQLLY